MGILALHLSIDKRVAYAIAVVLFTIGKVETLVHVCPDKTVRPLSLGKKVAENITANEKMGNHALS